MGGADVEEILRIFPINGFTMEYFGAFLIFVLPLKKREHPWVRICGSFALIVLTAALSQPLVAWGMPRMMALFLTIVAGIGGFLICAPLSVWDAVYGGICAYAVQHMAYALSSGLEVAFDLSGVVAQWLPLAIYGAVLLLSYVLFSRNMVIDGQYQIEPVGAIGAVVIIIPFAFFLSMLAESFYQSNEAGNAQLFMICRLYAVLCCLFVLYVQTAIHKRMHVQHELRTSRLLWHKQKEQYEMSRDTIERINRKCHDLKHQVAALRAVRYDDQRQQVLDELEKSVMVYDSGARTGNEVLDVVLTEKSLQCEQQGITWTCVADGSLLRFMNPVDLYTLFGNALDNAIESVREIAVPEQRVVALTLYGRGDLVILQLENYYAQDLRFQGELPRTRKEDELNHGYGLKSIQDIVGKYGGSMTILAEDHIFMLSIVIPMHSGREEER